MRLALKEYASAELRISEQQNIIEALQSRIDNMGKELEQSSGSADTLRQQITHITKDLTQFKSMLVQANRKLRERQKELQASESECASLREALSASEAARIDLAIVCSEQIRNAKSGALEHFKEFSERILIEREEVLSSLSVVSDLERDVRNAVSHETQKELQRLRQELFKARRLEAQKQKDIEFLQSQLIEAADCIAELTLAKGQK